MPTFPLGDPINGSPHSMCASLPTVADVHGYEQNDPVTRGSLVAGYPRFAVNRLRARIEEAHARRLGTGRKHVFATASARAAARAAAYAGSGAEAASHGGDNLVVARDPDTAARVKDYLQHAGGMLGSRVAEARLVARGLMEAPHAEVRVEVDPAAKVRTAVGAAMGVAPTGIVLAQSGMSAFAATFAAVNAAQATRGRPPRWLRVGWLYLDTMRVLERFGPSGLPPVAIEDVADLDAVAAALEAAPGVFAGIVVEFPTNPLVESTDLPALAALARRHGVVLVADPSLVSPWNARLFPEADVVTCSLTKYAAHAGDVLAGFAAVNPSSPWAGELGPAIAEAAEPLAAPDVARLAAQVDDAPGIVARINANARIVGAFLATHASVEKALWAEEPSQRARFAANRAPGGGPGAIVTFFPKGEDSLARFYDRVALAKSPSFGTAFTMLCPYLWLAHYDEVTSPEGRAALRARRLHPDLVRLSIGAEPVETILAALDAALA